MPQGFDIIAHRGASAEAPENTLAALHRAWERGAGWCEVDVQRTSDDVLVLVHDDTWQRTTGIDAPVRQTAWERVRGFDVGRHPVAPRPGERVPRLQDALSWCDRLRLNLEIKSPENDAGLAEAVADAVLAAGVADRCVLSCFDAATIDRLSARQDGLQLAYLGHEPVARLDAAVRLQVLAASNLRRHPDWLQGEFAVWAWTVDDPAEAEWLVARGVRGIITNDPARLLRHFPA